MTPSIDVAERMKIIAARMNAGQDTYAGRLDAWHSLGVVSGSFQTWQEMLKAAGADFQVIKRQLDFFGVKIDAFGTFRIDDVPVKGAEDKAIRVKSAQTGVEKFFTFLGPVGSDYQVIQHTSGFELLDHLVGSIDGAHYETMGTLDFGRTVWGQVDPNISIRVGDDVSDVLLSFHTSHDGSKAFDIYESMLRHVCRNTLRAGSLKRLAASLKVRHTKNAGQRISSLKTEIDEIRTVAMSMQDRLTMLAGRKVTRESMTAIMDRLFPQKKVQAADGSESSESSTRRENILSEILALYESNDQNAFPEQKDTAYSLLNSITNYVDHSRSSRGNGRAESAVFGSGDALKSRALDVIMESAQSMPVKVTPIYSRPAVSMEGSGLMGMN